jgi:hypothetical protein
MITATSAVLLGLTLEQAREALERPVDGKCFFLGGHCDNDAEPGSWLCPQHRAWTPNIATRDTTDARMQLGSAPRLREVSGR